MNYLALIWADGRPSREDLAVMQRELPVFGEHPEWGRVRLLGRELELPEKAATVRVRDGETLVADGPFAETKEFIAGFDLLDATGPDQAIAFAAACPISWFQPIEVRPFAGEVSLDERALAFGRMEDGGARPHLLCPWVDGETADPGLLDEVEAWREGLRVRGRHVLGHALAGPQEATTVRVRDGSRELTPGPFTQIPQVMVGIDVVNCADRDRAIEIAATHPLAREHAIEVRPFYVEADYR
jgi:hypothetical protein